MHLDERLTPGTPYHQQGAHAADGDAKFPTASVQALGDAGLLGLTLPTEVGGLAGRRWTWSRRCRRSPLRAGRRR